MLQEYVEKLVQMSASNSDVDILKGEITILQADRVKLVRRLNRLQEQVNPDRYFDPAAQLADQQEKLRLGDKIAALEEERNEVETTLSICKDEEAEAHRELEALKARQDELHKDQEIIEKRLAAARLANNDSSIENYAAALETCKEEASAKDAEVSIAEAKYQVIASNLEAVSEKLRGIEKNLKTYQTSRDEIDQKLGNPSSYINLAVQQKEMKAMEEVEQEIAKIDARLTEIENDPMMIADKIKTVMQDGNEQEALPLVEKLANIIESMPYASFIGTPKLEEALKDATERKAAMEAQINGNDYTNITSADLVEARIKYLQSRMAFLEEQQKNVASIVAQLDNDELFHTKDHVAQAKVKTEGLKSAVTEYETVVKNAVDESTLKRANLGRALSSKAKDLNTAENIYSAFVKDQRDDIGIAATLESSLLTAINQRIASCKEQLISVKGLNSKKKSERDVIAEARDRRMLAEANEEIAKIERWRGYDMSPSQMVAQLKDSYQNQQVEESPVLDPIIPDAFALQDGVNLAPGAIPEISLEEIPAQPFDVAPTYTETTNMEVTDTPVVPMDAQDTLNVEETTVEDNAQFEVPVVPIAEDVVNDTVNMNIPADDIPVAPFEGFGESEKEVVSAPVEEVLPAFEAPAPEALQREVHAVVRIEDLANIHNTGTPAQEVDTTLDADTEYLGFEDYSNGLKVA